jgi:hypothetical protein
VRLIESRVNGDFAYAINLGLHEVGFGSSQTSNINALNLSNCVLLNLPTLLPSSALQDMLAFKDVQPEIGVAGSRPALPNGELDQAYRGLVLIGLGLRGDQVLHSRPQESVRTMEARQ